MTGGRAEGSSAECGSGRVVGVGGADLGLVAPEIPASAEVSLRDRTVHPSGDVTVAGG